jgi:hypothetical protein
LIFFFFFFFSEPEKNILLACEAVPFELDTPSYFVCMFFFFVLVVMEVCVCVLV